MKKRLLKFQQTRSEKAVRLKGLVAITKASENAEARAWDADEETEAETLMTEIDDLDEQIRVVESQIRADGILAVETTKSRAMDTQESEAKKVSKRYSILKAMRGQMPGGTLDGVEKEMHDEAVREASDSGQSVSGLGVPSMLISLQGRDLTVGTAATAGNLVHTDEGEFIPALTPKLKVMDMGARPMTGLVGNLQLKKQTGVATAAWAGEQTPAAQTDPSVGLINLSPKRLAAYTDISNQLLIQSSIDAEGWVRGELSNAIARKLDATCINGSGTGNEPIGLMNFADVNTVAIGANGGDPTRAALLEMVKMIAVEDADIGDMSFLTTPGVRYKLQNTLLDAGSGRFVWGDLINNLLGYRAEISNNVPKDLTKGSGVDLNAIIFGVWNQLIIGQWAGADIIVDPYTRAKEGTVEVVVNSFWDINTRHDQAFSVIKDATVV